MRSSACVLSVAQVSWYEARDPPERGRKAYRGTATRKFARTLHGAARAPQGRGVWTKQLRFCCQILESVWHMDVDTHSRSTTTDRRRATKLDGYTIHLLKLDGTVATIEKKRRDGTAKLTVEVRDRTGERRIPVRLARNPRSPEFARAIGEMKAELLRRRQDARLS